MSRLLPAVGVDIGGTKIAAAVVAPNGHVTNILTSPTPGTATAVVAQVIDMVQSSTQSTGPLRVGIGAAGIVDPDRGLITSSTDAITGWAGTALAAQVAAVTGTQVRVVNDVTAFLLGEQAYGVARTHQHVLAVTVGTGIGGAMLVDGHLLRGAHHAAGHIGHLPWATATDRLCSCGRRGHIEAVASGPAMAATFAQRTGHSQVSLPDVVTAAQLGDERAVTVLAQGGEALGAVLGGLANALAPRLIVLGGGVIAGSSTYVDALQIALAQTLLPVLSDLRVLRTAVDAHATLRGAATAAQEAQP